MAMIAAFVGAEVVASGRNGYAVRDNFTRVAVRGVAGALTSIVIMAGGLAAGAAGRWSAGLGSRLIAARRLLLPLARPPPRHRR